MRKKRKAEEMAEEGEGGDEYDQLATDLANGTTKENYMCVK